MPKVSIYIGNKDYEDFKKLREFLLKNNMIPKDSDYQVIKFAIELLRSLVLKSDPDSFFIDPEKHYDYYIALKYAVSKGLVGLNEIGAISLRDFIRFALDIGIKILAKRAGEEHATVEERAGQSVLTGEPR